MITKSEGNCTPEVHDGLLFCMMVIESSASCFPTCMGMDQAAGGGGVTSQGPLSCWGPVRCQYLRVPPPAPTQTPALLLESAVEGMVGRVEFHV